MIKNCPHTEKTTVSIGGSANVEILADRCRACGELFNERTEV